MSLYRGYFAGTGVDPSGTHIGTEEDIYPNRVCKAKCTFLVETFNPWYPTIPNRRISTKRIDCPSRDAKACCQAKTGGIINRRTLLNAEMVCFDRTWRPLVHVVSGTACGLIKGTPNCPTNGCASGTGVVPRPSTPAPGIGPVVVINVIP
jgi:hypothetical protein